MMGTLTILFGWLLLVILTSVFTARWALRVWSRKAELEWPAKLAAALLGLSVACVFLGTLAALVRTLVAFELPDAEASQKARALAESISLAMNSAAAGIAIGMPAWAVWLVLGERKSTPR